MDIFSSSRNAFEVFLLVALIISGIGGLISPRSGSSAVASALPLWELYILYASLAISSGITLAGALGRKLISLYVERVGLMLLIGSVFAYAVVTLTQTSMILALPILTTIFLDVACFIRLLQINNELKAVKPQ